ncbi:MAG: pilus assembly protein [Nostocoides sp.]
MRDERGSAVVEFVVLGVVLLIPLTYLVMTLARVEAAAFAVTSASREAGRAFVTAANADDGRQRAMAAAQLAFVDHRFPDGVVTVRCEADPCLAPEARVHVAASVDVPLPLVPAVARQVVPLQVPVRTDYVAVVDRFREQP